MTSGLVTIGAALLLTMAEANVGYADAVSHEVLRLQQHKYHFKALKDKVTITEKHVHLDRWNGESFIRVKSPIPDADVIEEHGQETRWKQKDDHREIHVFEIDPIHPSSDGDLEYEVRLKHKPDSNVLELDYEDSGNLDYFFQPEQPPKTPEQIARGEIRGGDVWPEVINSWAVYHKTKCWNEYRCGKAFHIFRPKATDAAGNTVWGEIGVDLAAGKLRITLPQDFIDSAEYPVVIDPTFGYETAGSAGTTSIETTIVGSDFAANFTGRVYNISAYTTPSTTAKTFSAGIYNQDNTLVGGNTVGVTPAASGADWRDVPIANLAVTDTSVYILTVWGTGGAGTHTVSYDAGTTNQGHEDSNTNVWTWPNPLVPSHGDYKYSIHADGVVSVTSTPAEANQEFTDAVSVLRVKKLSLGEASQEFTDAVSQIRVKKLSFGEANEAYTDEFKQKLRPGWADLVTYQLEELAGEMEMPVPISEANAVFSDAVDLLKPLYLDISDIFEPADGFLALEPQKTELSGSVEASDAADVIEPILTELTGTATDEWLDAAVTHGPGYADFADSNIATDSVDLLKVKFLDISDDAAAWDDIVVPSTPSAGSEPVNVPDPAGFVEPSDSLTLLQPMFGLPEDVSEAFTDAVLAQEPFLLSVASDNAPADEASWTARINVTVGESNTAYSDATSTTAPVPVAVSGEITHNDTITAPVILRMTAEVDGSVTWTDELRHRRKPGWADEVTIEKKNISTEGPDFGDTAAYWSDTVSIDKTVHIKIGEPSDTANYWTERELNFVGAWVVTVEGSVDPIDSVITSKNEIVIVDQIKVDTLVDSNVATDDVEYTLGPLLVETADEITPADAVDAFQIGYLNIANTTVVSDAVVTHGPGYATLADSADASAEKIDYKVNAVYMMEQILVPGVSGTWDQADAVVYDKPITRLPLEYPFADAVDPSDELILLAVQLVALAEANQAYSDGVSVPSGTGSVPPVYPVQKLVPLSGARPL